MDRFCMVSSIIELRKDGRSCFDDNHVSIDGDTEIAFTESVDTRFEALGWHIIWVKKGNTGYDEIRAAIKEAKAVTDKPTLIKDHWPSSLKKFVTSSGSLSFPREQTDLKKLLPNMNVASLNNVITQGMNPKKRHEIEALAAVVSSVAGDVKTNTVIDLGAGQGYLSQVLSFEYQLSIIAIDASSHHGSITQAHAERIKKHYEAKMRKSR